MPKGQRKVNLLVSCLQCSKTFTKKNGPSKYCCNSCRWKAARNRNSTSLTIRKSNLKQLYGLSWESYNSMISSQDGKCLICKRKDIKFHVDHCHTYGHVRGLLCKHCNMLLGNAKDNIEVLASAIEYLRTDFKRNIKELKEPEYGY